MNATTRTRVGRKRIARRARMLFCSLLLANAATALAQTDFWQPANGPYEGYTRFFAINKTTGAIFAGTLAGGVMRSLDNGDNWMPVNNGFLPGALAQSALAINDRGDIFSGTTAVGMYRSTNNGDSWSPINTGLANLNIRSLVINDKGEIFAGTTNGGLFRTTNNGDTWTSANNGLPNLAVQVLAVNASGHLFAGTTGGVFRSIDNGANWTFIQNLPPANATALHINAQGHLLAAIAGVVYRSTDNGASFIALRNGLPVISITALITNARGDAFVGTGTIGGRTGVYRLINNDTTWTAANSGLTNPLVRALALNTKGDLFAGTNIGVFRSLDNAAIWKRISNKDFLANIIYSLAINPDPATPGLFAATFGGVFRSQDNGGTWTLVDKGLPGTTVASVFSDAPRRQLFAGLVGGVYRSKDNGENWSPANKGLVGDGTAFAINARGEIFAGTIANGMYRSTDNAENWTPINSGLTNLSVNPDAILINARNGQIFVGTDAGVFRSTNNGDNWTAVNIGLPAGPCRGLILTNNGDLFAALNATSSAQAGVYKSSDNGASWTMVNGGGATFTVAINANGFIFQGTASGAFRSRDNGKTWTRINSGLAHPFIPPPISVFTFAIDADGFIFTGTEQGGVFRSTESTNNKAPVVANIIPDQNLTVGGGVFVQNLRTVFNDADDDSLTYAVSTSDSNKVAASVLNRFLRVTPKSGGRATISITASDPFGGTVSTSFVVIVANRQPVVAQIIPAQNLAGNGAQFTRNLRTVFRDPDGDALTFTASSSAASLATASVVDSTLTVTGVARGNATITVTANDGNNGAATTTFTVNVANSSPKLAQTIPDTTITLGVSTFRRDLNTPPIFSDPDNDALTYTATSSAATIATAAISGSRLTVTAVGGGRATITITVNDGNGGSFSTSFAVTVNRSPVVTTIPNQVITLGSAPFTRDLVTAFNDPDGDTLTYTHNSSAANIAATSLSGSRLTVTAMAAGMATITVSANDRRGGAAQTQFTVTVNRKPVVANAIPNQTLSVNGAPFRRDLNAAPAVFNDPDGDALTYTPRSIPLSVATVNISGANLSVTAVGLGNATITIFADDGKGGRDSTQFTVAAVFNQPPLIASTAPLPQASGQPVNITATITDDKSIASVTLSYRRGSDLNFTSAAMAGTGAAFQATVPGSASTSRGLEYFIEAQDGDGATTRFPASGVIAVLIQITSEAKPSAQVNGSEQTAYRLVSVPFQADDPSVAKVLEDNLGAYNPEVWRLFGLQVDQPLNNKTPYVEFPNAGSFTPGQSLFLIVRDPGKVIDAGPGRSARTDREFKIPLLAGHNFIATPFNFSLPINKLRLKSGSAINLRIYQGNWIAANELAPWEGYYLPNNATTVDTLFVNPNLSSSSIVSKKDESAKNESAWRVQILARCDQARDTENYAGVAPASNDHHDDNDLTEPPPIGEYVSVYFPHEEWQKPLARYSNDMRSSANPNQRWRFVVESNIANQLVNLRFDKLQEIDPSLQIFLVDEALNFKQNLRENAAYQYQPRSHELTKAFTLIVGKDDFVAEQTASAQGVPENFVLEQNFPNPFNPETAIRFGLPQQSVVTIKIYDLAGREIATVLDRVELAAGRHQRVWDGRDAQGRVVPSGIYFYRLAAGSFVTTKKLTLMK